MNTPSNNDEVENTGSAVGSDSEVIPQNPAGLSVPQSSCNISSEELEFRKKILWNPDPEVCFRNLLKFGTNERARLREFEMYLDVFVKLEFDKMLGIDLDAYRPVFKLYYGGFKSKFNTKYVKHNALYGPEAFAWTIRQFLIEVDYQFKKQKVKAEEFEFLAYLLTDLCFKQGGDCIVHSNFFVGKKSDGTPCGNSERYKNYTSRKINIDKLNYILGILTKYDIIVEGKVGVKGKTHLRNFYSIGKNNLFYGYKRPQQNKARNSVDSVS